jgi:PAS domain S-box-containing protein
MSNQIQEKKSQSAVKSENKKCIQEIEDLNIVGSDDVFREIMESMDVLVYVVNINTYEVIYANRHVKEVFDISVGDVCWKVMQSKQSGPCLFCSNAKLLNGNNRPGQSGRFEEQNTNNGRWYDMVNRAAYWSNGELVRITIATDITKRKQMEDSLFESNEKLNTLLKNSPDTIQVIDKYFDILYTNEIVKASMPKEILGQNILERIDPKYHIDFGKTFKHVIENKETRSFEFKDILGKWWETQIAHITIGNNSYCAMLITRDIDERKRMEESLLESNEKLNTLLKHSPDTISVINDDFTILYTNKALKSKSIIETLGGNFLEKIHPDYQKIFQDLFWEVIKLKRPGIIEFKNTKSKWWESKITQLTVGNNSKCAMLITSDIEVRKKNDTFMQQAQVELQKRIKESTGELETAYQQLIQSEKMAALGILISGIAHEINNPNSFISFNIPILKDYIDAMLPILDDYSAKHKDSEFVGMSYSEFKEDILKLLTNMEHGSQRINKTVSHLKEFASAQKGKEFQLVDLGSIIDKSVELCKNKVNKLVKSFEIKLPDTPLNLSTIPQSLEQVLINLLINAAQSVDKEDSYVQLVVKVKSKSDPEVVHIDIVDNGCGIEGDNMSNIFKPFYSTKNKEIGLGLGLNITKKLTDDIGGKIEVKSDFGVGSRFRLILPIYT